MDKCDAAFEAQKYVVTAFEGIGGHMVSLKDVWRSAWNACLEEQGKYNCYSSAARVVYALTANEDIPCGRIIAVCAGMTGVCLVQEHHHYAKPYESEEWPIGISAMAYKKGDVLKYDPLEETEDIKFSGDVPVSFR